MRAQAHHTAGSNPKAPCACAAAGIDAILATKKFSQLGGLQLDRDVRAMVAYAGELTQRPVRDKFAELTQKATLLSLEVGPQALLCVTGWQTKSCQDDPILWKIYAMAHRNDSAQYLRTGQRRRRADGSMRRDRVVAAGCIGEAHAFIMPAGAIGWSRMTQLPR